TGTSTEERVMRKLVESTFMSLDGVIDNPQNWSPPYWDDEHAAYSQKLMATADELLLGRKTYEGFAEAWPQRSGDPFTDRINAMPKYVASRSLQETTWNATVLDGESHVWVFPGLAASGDSLIDGVETTHLKLVETTPFASGIVVNAYAPR